MTHTYMTAGRSMPLPGFAASRAIWPVWADSAKKPVRFAPMAKKAAVRLYHAARRFERQTRSYGRQDGALGRNGLAILHALLFDFLNFRTGRLDPAISTIARAANISESSVKRGLARLKASGVLTWVRRCIEVVADDGRFQLRQQSNAYAVCPASQWRGFAEPPAPAPHPTTWGASPPLLGAIELASEMSGAMAMTVALMSDPTDRLAAALARLGGAVIGRKP